MIELGKYWANASSQLNKLMFFNAETSPARCLDIAGVASSILATPTMISLGNSCGFRGFSMPEAPSHYHALA